jgi:hypothetical protein
MSLLQPNSVLVSTGLGEISGDPVQVASDTNFRAEISATLSRIREQAKAKFDLANRFNALAAQWSRERGISSSLSKVALCPSYQKIIGLGPDVVPLILQRLEEENEHPDYWFWALESITHDNPVSEGDVGNFRAMAKAWLAWGHSHGKLATSRSS